MFEIKQTPAGFVLLDDGLTFGLYQTEREAEEELQKLRQADAIQEVIETALSNLQDELKDKFGLANCQSLKAIRESL